MEAAVPGGSSWAGGRPGVLPRPLPRAAHAAAPLLQAGVGEWGAGMLGRDLDAGSARAAPAWPAGRPSGCRWQRGGQQAPHSPPASTSLRRWHIRLRLQAGRPAGRMESQHWEHEGQAHAAEAPRSAASAAPPARSANTPLVNTRNCATYRPAPHTRQPQRSPTYRPPSSGTAGPAAAAGHEGCT